MPDVVEERGGDQRVVGARGPGQGGRLQGVVELADLLVVAVVAEPLEEPDDLGHRARGRAAHGTGRPSKSPISDTGTRPPGAAAASSAALRS